MKETQLLQDWTKIRQNCTELAESIAGKPVDSHTIYREKIKISSFPLFDLISHLHKHRLPFFYWHDRGNTTEILALHPLMTIEGERFAEFERKTDRFYENWDCKSPETAFYGGMRFNGYSIEHTSWNGWPAVFFMLPQMEFFLQDGEMFFAINYTAESRGQLGTHVRNFFEMIEDQIELLPLPAPGERVDNPTLITWKENIRRAVRQFDPNELVKVVLARETTINFRQRFPAFTLLNELQKHNTHSTYHFVFSADGQDIFAGITPERLYVRDSNRLKSEAIAGTRRRGRNPEEDRHLEEELLSSNKDRFEHKLVMDSIENQFYFICDEVKKENDVSVIKLDHVQHLYCSFEGILKRGIRDPQILAALHPTPAVGGYPKDLALQFIAKHETFDRGWYAAPIGWFNRNGAEFAVAIRSALIKEYSVHLYAGAGIVKGSDPQKEWDELEDKITIFKKIFNL